MACTQYSEMISYDERLAAQFLKVFTIAMVFTIVITDIFLAKKCDQREIKLPLIDNFIYSLIVM